MDTETAIQNTVNTIVYRLSRDGHEITDIQKAMIADQIAGLVHLERVDMGTTMAELTIKRMNAEMVGL